MTRIIYRINDQNRIVSVNEAWDRFAERNGGHGLTGEKLYGCNLYDFIADEGVRSIYRAVVNRARGGRSMRFRYRCDAPAERRDFEMDVRATSPHEVEFTSVLIRVAPRLLQAGSAEGSALTKRILRMCSWCHAVSEPSDHWQSIEGAIDAIWAAPPVRVSHGICPACAESMLARIRQ